MQDNGEVTRRVKILGKYLAERSANPEATRWLELIREAQFGRQFPGGLSGWANRHDSQDVETLQAEFDFVIGMQIQRVWTPGLRNAVWNPNGIRFFGDPTRESDRKFHGVVTIGSKLETYVGWDRNHFQLVAYHHPVVE